MVLDLPKDEDFENLFPHSKEFDQGLGTRTVRVGQDAIIVAQDGTGDFDTIEGALKTITSTGGKIYVKSGTYIPTATLTIPFSNVTIEGSGESTIIKPTTMAQAITASGKTKIILKNFKIDGTNMGAGSDGISITASATDTIIERITFANINATGIGIILNASNRAQINKTIFENSPADAMTITDCSKCIIAENQADTGTARITIAGNSDDNIIIGNICEEIEIEDSTSQRNIIIGNQCTQAISNAGTSSEIYHNVANSVISKKIATASGSFTATKNAVTTGTLNVIATASVSGTPIIVFSVESGSGWLGTGEERQSFEWRGSTLSSGGNWQVSVTGKNFDTLNDLTVTIKAIVHYTPV